MSGKATLILSGMLVLQAVALAALLLGTPLHWQAPDVQLPAPDTLVPVTLQHSRPQNGGFTEQVERPLFVAGRRSVAAESVQSVDEATKDLKMLGLFGPADGTGGAIISMGGAVSRVAIGAKVGLLTLVRIDGLDAVLWDGAAERVVRLRPLPRPGASSVTAAGAQPLGAGLPKPALQQMMGVSVPQDDDRDGVQ